MSESGRKAIPNVREWSGGPQGNPGVVGGLPECLGVVGGPPGCPEDLPDVREWSENPHGNLGGPLGLPGVVGSLSRMSGSGRKILPDIREGLPDIREGLPDIRESLLDIREGFPTSPGYSGGTPELPGGHLNHSQASVRVS